jgi:hypothetical protein
MIDNIEKVWELLDRLNVSKVFILYIYKKTKRMPEPQATIQSVIVTTKCGKNDVAWDGEICRDKSSILKIIGEAHEGVEGKVDGMMTYNNIARKVCVSGKIKQKVYLEFSREI